MPHTKSSQIQWLGQQVTELTSPVADKDVNVMGFTAKEQLLGRQVADQQCNVQSKAHHLADSLRNIEQLEQQVSDLEQQVTDLTEKKALLQQAVTDLPSHAADKDGIIMDPGQSQEQLKQQVSV